MDPDSLVKLSEFFDVAIDYIVGNIEHPITLTKLRFRDNKEYKKTPEELFKEYEFKDYDGNPIPKEEVKKILEQIRALLDD